jgi:hypothetical protein
VAGTGTIKEGSKVEAEIWKGREGRNRNMTRRTSPGSTTPIWDATESPTLQWQAS